MNDVLTTKYISEINQIPIKRSSFSKWFWETKNEKKNEH